MRGLVLFCALLAMAGPAAEADVLVANGTIQGQTLIGEGDVIVAEGDVPGALRDPAEAVGLEARINLYPGRPIRPGDLQPPAVIDRNEIVTMRYDHHGLVVITDGRAMDRAALGDRLRVLNLSSRTTVTATAAAPGLVTVGPNQ